MFDQKERLDGEKENKTEVVKNYSDFQTISHMKPNQKTWEVLIKFHLKNVRRPLEALCLAVVSSS